MSAGAFGGDAEHKAALLARLDRHIHAGTLCRGATAWDGTGGTPRGVVARSVDSAVYQALTGYPAALAELLDPLFSLLPDDVGAAFARDWLTVVTPGADLACVPTLIVLDLLSGPAAIAGSVTALHQAVLQGNVVPRARWAAVRAELIAQADAERDEVRRQHLALAEAACWPASSSRSILTSMAEIWCAIGDAEEDPSWSREDAARAQAMLESLWVEHRSAQEAGCTIHFPSLFAERDADLAHRFEANLILVNRRHLARRQKLADIVLTWLEAAVPI